MNVTFHHPPALNAAGALSANPFVDFDPINPAHYPNGTGLYIYGLRLNIEGEEEQLRPASYKPNLKISHENKDQWKFVPLYTGIAHQNNLSQRLSTHYVQERANGISKVAMFDFSLDKFNYGDIISRYADMGYYDLFLGTQNKLESINKIRHLVWFQNLVFYWKRFGVIPNFPVIIPINANQFESIRPGGSIDIDILPPYPFIINDVNSCRDKVITTKARFDDHFYFVYAKFKDGNGNIINEEPDITDWEEHDLGQRLTTNIISYETFLNGIEHATKKALKRISINTTANSNQLTLQQIDIDLSQIQGELINLVNSLFTPYINPLVIPFTPL